MAIAHVLTGEAVHADVDLVELYFERGWTDGMPVVPPTIDKIEAVVTALGGHPDVVECKVAPRWGELTRQVLAINMVMAGCKPECAPVVRAALLALTDLLVVPNVYEAFSKEQIGRLKRLADDPAVGLRVRILLCQKLAARRDYPVYDKIAVLYRGATDRVAERRVALDRRGAGFRRGWRRRPIPSGFRQNRRRGGLEGPG